MVNNNPQQHTTDRQHNQTNARGSEKNRNGVDEPEAVAARLRAAGLDIERFIQLEEGRKQCYDHTEYGPGAVTGNYGVYCGGGLVGLDIDDKSAWNRVPGTNELPPTFTVSTPHDGSHRYYCAPEAAPWVVRAATGGSLNPSLSWGELYLSKYLVGPGSELRGCDRTRCSSCRPAMPSQYEVADDRPVAEITEEDLTALLGGTSRIDSGRQGSIVEFGVELPPSEQAGSTGAANEGKNNRPSYQQRLGERVRADPEERTVWLILKRKSAVEEGRGVRFDTLVDATEEQGVDALRTGEIVRDWLRRGALCRCDDPNRLEIQNSGRTAEAVAETPSDCYL